jgi:hypothetical protein
LTVTLVGFRTTLVSSCERDHKAKAIELVIPNQNIAVRSRFGKKQRQYEDAMPTFIRMVAKLEEPAELLNDHYRGIALFCGIGLLVALIAVSCGEQGVWF